MIKIRRFRPEDAARLAEILHLAVTKIGVKYYNAGQVRVWSPTRLPAQQWLESGQYGQGLFVAASDTDIPAGFVELEQDSHIHRFYCHPDYAGQGVGSRLYDHPELRVRAIGAFLLYVEASEAALGFFRAKGFTLSGRNDFIRDGVPIHNYRMQKPLHAPD